MYVNRINIKCNQRGFVGSRLVGWLLASLGIEADLRRLTGVTCLITAVCMGELRGRNATAECLAVDYVNHYAHDSDACFPKQGYHNSRWRVLSACAPVAI
jgi:hypothetical protein